MQQTLDFMWVYPMHPLAVFQMATRLDHLDEKAKHLGHERHAVKELRERGGVFRSITTRQVDVEIPWWARKFFTPRNMITQTQRWEPPTWDGARRYDALVEVGGVPVTITGEGRLTPVDISATRYEIHLDVSSKTFLIGGKIVRVVSDALQRGIDGEHDFRLLWMARNNQLRK